MSRPAFQAPVIIGRDAELARVRWLLDRGAVSSSALLVEGTAGIGKSTLVTTAVAQAWALDWTVLHCSPGWSETGYGYAGLADLIGKVISELPEIPDVQRRALDVATHRADAGQPADPHLVAAGAAGLLRALAARGPVLLVVDDMQWLDSATDAVLDFVSRRLGGAPIAVLVARRAEHPGAAPWGLDRHLGDEAFGQLWLSGLSQDELHEVVHRRLHTSLPRPVLARLHAICEGNPLMALEMAGMQRDREAAPHPDDPWPVPESLVRLIAPRLRALGQPSGDVLLAASAMASPTVEGLRAALDEDVAAGLEAAEVAGLVRVSGNKVTFGHPLFASVLYSEAPAPRRRAIHRRLAAVEPELESRARHLALGTIGPDETVAQALENAAVDAHRRGAVVVAADLLRLARSRTPSHGTTADGRRIALLADALFDSGDLTAARELLDKEIPELAAGPLRARALMVRGTIAWHQQNGVVAAKLLESALDDAKADLELVGQLHSRLSVFYDTDCAEACRQADAAVSALEQSGEPDLLAGALINLFYTEAQLGLPPRLELLRRGLELEDPRGSTDRSTIPGIWYLAVDSTVDHARDRFAAMLACSRERGDVSGEADLLTRLGEVELVADNLSAARDYADAATTAALQLGQQFADPARRLRAFVDAHAGRLDEARQVATDGADRAEASGDLVIAVAYLRVLAFVAASEADSAAVLDYTASSRRHLATIGIKEPVGRMDPAVERICALAELDRIQEAEAELAEFEHRYEQFPRSWMQPVLVRGRVLVSASRGDIDAAIAATDPAANPQWDHWRRFDQARVLLLRGRLLRRARRSGAAAETLAEAEAILSALGYPVWAAMTRAELARVGRRRGATADLTETERRVAELVAKGMTNKQVAAALFMSPKTVEAHVARVYRKLGIRSRAELGRAMI
jgi:DNA-binding CsgD family transcriptional regulator